MAQVTRKELARLVHDAYGNISQDVMRDKLPALKKYDTENPVIARYIDAKLRGVSIPTVSPEEMAVFTAATDAVDEVKADLKTQKTEKEIARIEAATENTIKRNRFLDIQHAKLLAELAPVELSKKLLARHIKFMGTLFIQAANNFVDDVVVDAGLGLDARGRYITTLIDGVNKSMDESLKDIEKEMNEEIKQYVTSLKIK